MLCGLPAGSMGTWHTQSHPCGTSWLDEPPAPRSLLRALDLGGLPLPGPPHTC